MHWLVRERYYSQLNGGLHDIVVAPHGSIAIFAPLSAQFLLGYNIFNVNYTFSQLDVSRASCYIIWMVSGGGGGISTRMCEDHLKYNVRICHDFCFCFILFSHCSFGSTIDSFGLILIWLVTKLVFFSCGVGKREREREKEISKFIVITFKLSTLY